MNKNAVYPLVFAIVSSLMVGCAQVGPSSVQRDLGMMAVRKDMQDYVRVRDEFIQYARSRDASGMYSLMAPFGYDQNAMYEFYDNEIYPFFADYKQVVSPDVFNMVTDEDGNPGYTIYGFIETTNGKRKPYAMAIVEKGKRLAVKNIVINRCFNGLHADC